ncbi:hypothetical protein DPMN_034432 [Dreissena polymorpha]|uniref:Uncharacterized protein n=1 Tax=Dreissena polymorpha TaxID=45954 RepID=A0A9D4M6V8_DREPO|nr:hypothetical protein DPMN_034432 [Dreissena polymorpha]
MIAGPLEDDETDPHARCKQREKNAEKLKLVHAAVVEDNNRTLDDILTAVNVSKESYMQKLKVAPRNPTIMLHRCPWETRINNYNPDLLKL